MANYRNLAKDRLAKADKLLSTGDADDLIYACLELRKCIEAQAYELLTGYLAEAPLKALDAWQPDKVIRELLIIDPEADISRRIRIKRNGQNGEPDGDWKELGEDRRIKAKWASKAYHRLGNYLHIPTLRQQRVETPLDLDGVRRSANEIRDALAHALGSSIWNVVFSESVKFECFSCDSPIKRRTKHLKTGAPVECGNCGQMHDAKEHPDGNYSFVPHALRWECRKCNEPRSILQGLAKDGADVSCPKCGDGQILARAEVWELVTKELIGQG